MVRKIQILIYHNIVIVDDGGCLKNLGGTSLSSEEIVEEVFLSIYRLQSAHTGREVNIIREVNL